MRTIIVSDISETSESIIPYGLNVGKYTHTRVDLFHGIDPSIVQGKYSSLSDSQSITPGQKLSHEEILHREMGIIDGKLSMLLSRQASMLNYPVRINTITEIGDTESSISKQIGKHDNPLVITGIKPGSSMFVNLQELLVMISKLNAMVLILPRGQKFRMPTTCCLVTDFYDEGNKKMEKLFQWLNPLVTKFFTSAVVKINSNNNRKKEITDWISAIQPYIEKAQIGTPEIVHIDYMNIAFESICNRKNPDLIVLPKNKDSHFSNYLFNNDNVEKLLESVKLPVLLY
jgi:hypothetical protein